MKHDIPDKEELTIKRAQDGSLTLRAYVSGHPSQVGFGEDEHVSYLLLDGKSALQLKDALEPRYGRQSSEDLFWQLVAEKTECIADILVELIGLSEVFSDTDFFEVGGDSLLAVRLINAIKSRFAVDITMRELFDSRTVANISDIIDERSEEKMDEGEI